MNTNKVIYKFIRSIKLHKLSNIPIHKDYKELYELLDNTFRHLNRYESQKEIAPQYHYYGHSKSDIVFYTWNIGDDYTVGYMNHKYINKLTHILKSNKYNIHHIYDIPKVYINEFLNIKIKYLHASPNDIITIT